MTLFVGVVKFRLCYIMIKWSENYALGFIRISNQPEEG